MFGETLLLLFRDLRCCWKNIITSYNRLGHEDTEQQQQQQQSKRAILPSRAVTGIEVSSACNKLGNTLSPNSQRVSKRLLPPHPYQKDTCIIFTMISFQIIKMLWCFLISLLIHHYNLLLHCNTADQKNIVQEIYEYTVVCSFNLWI